MVSPNEWTTRQQSIVLYGRKQQTDYNSLQLEILYYI